MVLWGWLDGVIVAGDGEMKDVEVTGPSDRASDRVSKEALAYPFDYLAYLLARASNSVSAEFHEALRRAGIPVSTWRIMASISDKPRTVSELADIVLMQQPTLSKALDRLEGQGLVVRERREGSRRKVHVTPTEKGRALAARLRPKAMAHEQEVLEGMSEEEAAQIKAGLRRLIRHFERNDDE